MMFLVCSLKLLPWSPMTLEELWHSKQEAYLAEL